MNYGVALKISGCNEGLLYKNGFVNENDQNEKKKRKRNIIWYNPSK